VPQANPASGRPEVQEGLADNALLRDGAADAGAGRVGAIVSHDEDVSIRYGHRAVGTFAREFGIEVRLSL
jgi:hypothetical protein